MKTLMIKDLSRTEELDRAAMASVHGGMGQYSMASPFYMPSFYGPDIDVMKNDFNFNASQSLGQSQNTVVNNGNNVAFANNITANVKPTQNGTNTINFG